MSKVEAIFTIEDLKSLKANPRKHTERNMSMLARSLGEFGAGRGIVVDEDGVVLAGNGVLDAAIEAGFDRIKLVEVDGDELVVVQVSHLTPEQKQRYALADNRTAELSGWDADAIRKLIEDGISLDLFWSSDELDDVIGGHDFVPTIDPKASWSMVTDRQLERTGEKLEHRFDGERVFDTEEHTCPACGSLVFVRR